MRQTSVVLSIVLAAVLAFIAPGAWAAQEQASSDRAYNTGYEAGNDQGRDDALAGRQSDFSRATAYRQATEGWTGQVNRNEYRRNYRLGFRDGYRDGYREARRESGQFGTRRGTIASRDTIASNDAFVSGYREGYNEGRRDRGNTYRPTENRLYQEATTGYDASQGTSLETYKSDFRQGFRSGYDDGYYNRSYDASRTGTSSSIGGTLPSSSRQIYSDEAFDNGYRAGYDGGRQDAGRDYRPTASSTYRNATLGYRRNRAVSLTQYKQDFRQGYEAGYDDGYNGRRAEARRDAPRGFGTRSGRISGSDVFIIPAGTTLRLKLNEAIGTRISQVGQQFSATVSEPVYTQDANEVAIPTGSVVHGTVTQVERPGRVSGTARMQLRYETLSLPGGFDYSLSASTAGVDQSAKSQAEIEEEGQVEAEGNTKRDVGTVAAGAALGAIIGAVAGGGKGAAVGAGIGSAAGIGAVLATRGRDVELPAGTPMDIRLDQPLELRRNTSSTNR